jgi:hypothetical protein
MCRRSRWANHRWKSLGAVEVTCGQRPSYAVMHAWSAAIGDGELCRWLEEHRRVPPIRPGESCLDIVNGRIPGGTRG